MPWFNCLPVASHGPSPRLNWRPKSRIARLAAGAYHRRFEANEARDWAAVPRVNIEQDPSGALRYKIISRYRAYHGNTAGAMAATGRPKEDRPAELPATLK